MARKRNESTFQRYLRLTAEYSEARAAAFAAVRNGELDEADRVAFEILKGQFPDDALQRPGKPQEGKSQSALPTSKDLNDAKS